MSDTKYITLDNLATFKTNYDSIVNNIREVAEGKTATYVIDAKSDITGTEDANGQFTNVSAITGLTIADLKLGDVILVKALDVSDYWVSQLNKTGDVVTSVSLNKMETTKVDLTQFYTKTQIDDTFKYDLPLLDLLPNNTKLINNYSMAEITQAVWGTTTFSNIGSKAVIRRIKCYYEVDGSTVSIDNGIAIITFKNIFSSYYTLNLELINSLIDYHYTWTNYNDTAETAITVSNNKVEANATVPSGTSLNALSNLRIGNSYYNIPAYKSFNDSWTINSTTSAFCADLVSDSNVKEGMAYVGMLNCSDLPNNIAQAECIVEIIKEDVSNGKHIHLILLSADTQPYHWEYNYVKIDDNYTGSGWKGYVTEDELNDTLINNLKLADLSTKSYITSYTLNEVADIVWGNHTLSNLGGKVAIRNVTGHVLHNNININFNHDLCIIDCDHAYSDNYTLRLMIIHYGEIYVISWFGTGSETSTSVQTGVDANVTIPSGTTATELSNLKIGSSYYKIPTTSINNHTGRFNLWGALVQDYTGENPLIAICPALRLRLYNQNGQWELQYLEYDSSYNLDYSKLMTFMSWIEQKYCEYPEITINDYVNNVNYSGKTLVLTAETQNNVPHLVLRGIIQKEDGTPCNLSVAVPVETDPQTQDPVIGTPLVSIDEFSGGSSASSEQFTKIKLHTQESSLNEYFTCIISNEKIPNVLEIANAILQQSFTTLDEFFSYLNTAITSSGSTDGTMINLYCSLIVLLSNLSPFKTEVDYEYQDSSELPIEENLQYAYSIIITGSNLITTQFSSNASATFNVDKIFQIEYNDYSFGSSSSSEYNKMQRYTIGFNSSHGLVITTKLTQEELAQDIAYTNSHLDAINTAMGTSFTHITTIADLSTTLTEANTFDNTGNLASMLVAMFVYGELLPQRLVSIYGFDSNFTFPILKYTPINQNDNIVNYSFTYLDGDNQFQTVTIDGLNATFSYDEF